MYEFSLTYLVRTGLLWGAYVADGGASLLLQAQVH